MADNSVGARHESHESEASKALMFSSDNASPEKSCFVVDLVRFFLALLTSFCVVPDYHQRGGKSSTEEKVFFFVCLFFQIPRSPLRESSGRKGAYDRRRNCLS